MRVWIIGVLALCAFAGPARAQTAIVAAAAEKEAATLAAKFIKNKLHAFKEKRAGACHGKSCGYIGTDGKTVIPPIFTAVTPFNEGHAAVKLVNRWGLIDKTGRYVINPEYEEMGEYSEGLVAAKKDGLWMFLDKNGKQKVDLPFPDVRKFSEGLAAVQVEGKWGYIDKSGRFAIKPKYAAAGDFSDGLAPVRAQADKGWGYINRNGDVKIEPQFDAAESFSEGMASVQLDTKWGFIDKKGRFVIDPQFAGSRSFHEGLAAVKDASRLWGYVDAKGRQKMKPAFSEATDYSGGLAKVETKGKAFFLDSRGKDAGIAGEYGLGGPPDSGIGLGYAPKAPITWNILNFSRDAMVAWEFPPPQGVTIPSFGSLTFVQQGCGPKVDCDRGSCQQFSFPNTGNNEDFDIDVYCDEDGKGYGAEYLNFDGRDNYFSDGGTHYQRYASAPLNEYGSIYTIVGKQDYGVKHTVTMYTVDEGRTIFIVAYDTDPHYAFSQQKLQFSGYPF